MKANEIVETWWAKVGPAYQAQAALTNRPIDPTVLRADFSLYLAELEGRERAQA